MRAAPRLVALVLSVCAVLALPVASSTASDPPALSGTISAPEGPALDIGVGAARSSVAPVGSTVVPVIETATSSAKAKSATKRSSSKRKGSAKKRSSSRKKKRVSKRIGSRGGLLRGPRGTALYVPAGVVKRKTRVSITRLRAGKFDFHIAGKWQGVVGVTMPPVRRTHVVGHNIDNVWLPEGRPGQRTVWVTSLSKFDTFKSKAKAAVCFLYLRRAQVLTCLAEKLPNVIGLNVARWIAEKIGANCILTAATYGAAAPLALVLEDPCYGTAGEGDFQFTQPPSGLTVKTNPGGPVQPNTFNPQAPASRPQPPAPAPVPTAPPSKPVPPPAPAPAPRTWSQQQGSYGANTFRNPHNASGMGHKIPAMSWVQVSCKVHAPQIASVNPDGYWYRIASPPWSDQYYAAANTFWNGDVPGRRPYTHNTDWAVPNC